MYSHSPENANARHQRLIMRPLRGNPLAFGISTGPLPVAVTTRIITFLVGDSCKPLFATVTGRGPHPKYVYIYILYDYIMVKRDKESCSRVFSAMLEGYRRSCSGYQNQHCKNQANKETALMQGWNLSCYPYGIVKFECFFRIPNRNPKLI